MTSQANALNWFEIPVSEMKRAKTFYETIFGISMNEQEMMERKMAYFPADGMNGKVNGALVESVTHKTSAEGIKIYLNGNPDLQNALDKVEKAGGKIAMPKTKISDEVGHIAFIIDTEGNNVGLHSNK
jgi:predicted enzyme related to lactoylglutathione lyase